jgi:hypothetical protein
MDRKPWEYVFRRVDEIHAFQDGFTLLVVFALAGTAPALAALFGVVLLGDGIGPKKLLKRADDLVRTEEIRENPEYFLVGGILGAAVGVVVGTVLAPYLPAIDVMAFVAA